MKLHVFVNGQLHTVLEAPPGMGWTVATGVWLRVPSNVVNKHPPYLARMISRDRKTHIDYDDIPLQAGDEVMVKLSQDNDIIIHSPRQSLKKLQDLIKSRGKKSSLVDALIDMRRKEEV